MKIGLLSMAAIILGFSVLTSSVSAARDTTVPVRPNRVKEVNEKRADTKRPALQKKGTIVGGKVTANDGSTLTVDKEGSMYTVLTGDFGNRCITRVAPRYFGKVSVSDIKVGHVINVFGKFQEGSELTIQACLIRDRSIVRRKGAVIGEVTAITDTGWVIKRVGSDESMTIQVAGGAVYVDRREKTITYGDILVGHKIRVKGIVDRDNKTVVEVKHVKDFSIPVPSPTAVVE